MFIYCGITWLYSCFQIWLWIEKLPARGASTLFTFCTAGRKLLTFSLRHDGKLELRSTGNRDAAVFSKSNLPKTRWTHVTLVHYPHRVSKPTISMIRFWPIHLVSLRLTSICRIIHRWCLEWHGKLAVSEGRRSTSNRKIYNRWWFRCHKNELVYGFVVYAVRTLRCESWLRGILSR